MRQFKNVGLSIQDVVVGASVVVGAIGLLGLFLTVLLS